MSWEGVAAGGEPAVEPVGLVVGGCRRDRMEERTVRVSRASGVRKGGRFVREVGAPGGGLVILVYEVAELCAS